MGINIKTSLILLFFVLHSQIFLRATTYNLKVNQAELQLIGNQIWKNECNKSIDGLTCWNNGEDCASLGIGHFIWYPKKHKSNFNSIFPKLIRFIKSKKNKRIKIPYWLEKSSNCPWSNRDEFYKNFNSRKMRELRDFLKETIDLQILFLFEQAKAELTRLINKAPYRQRRVIKEHLDKLLATPNGTYILIDYINFKGLGLSQQEQYNKKSWGLYAVLIGMDKNKAKKNIAKEFVDSAERVLTQRVKNAPKDRDEEHWLPGWKARLQTYLNFNSR